MVNVAGVKSKIDQLSQVVTKTLRQKTTSQIFKPLYSRTPHTLTVTWLDLYCVVSFSTIQKSEWSVWRHHHSIFKTILAAVSLFKLQNTILFRRLHTVRKWAWLIKNDFETWGYALPVKFRLVIHAYDGKRQSLTHSSGQKGLSSKTKFKRRLIFSSVYAFLFS